MQDRLQSRHAARVLTALAGASLSIARPGETDPEGFVHVGEVNDISIVRPWTPDPPALITARKADAEAAKETQARFPMNRAQRRAATRKMLRTSNRR